MSLLAEWCLTIGAVLVSMVLIGSIVERLPFTPAILYLGAGYAIGAGGAALHGLHPIADATLIRILSEIAIAISLFAVGLTLRAPISRHAWRVPLLLAVPAMILTIALLAIAAWKICGLPPGVALVLAAILAPTDPVLGADVHVERPGDRDYVRFGVTAEGGLNDGLAMPAVILGLGALGLRKLGPWATEWVLWDVLWLPLGGLAIGWFVGILIGRLVLYLRSRHRLAIGLEEFLGFGVIALAFGAAGVVDASEFLSVFAAGLALRNIERRTSATVGINPDAVSIDDKEAAVDPDRAAAHMAQTLLAFNTQVEHIAELALVMVVGGLLASVELEWQSFALAAILFAIARPVSVAATLAGTATQPAQTRLIAWFGIRGIGSLYYLAFVIEAGLAEPWASRLTSIVLTVVATSIVVHGVSATPLMHRYYHRAR
jgi:NhaP-type Na+/H+ or K+/H+ antiporter